MNETLAIVGAAATCATVAITLGGLLYSISTRLAKIELKIDTVWAIVMRRYEDSLPSGE